MEALLLELAKQLPATVCVMLVVLYFLRHIREERLETQAFLAAMAAGCHVVQADAAAAIRENTRMLGHIEARHGKAS